ncbi:hypothetical protein EOS_33080 [Caballeronia mineralivorans PML1(12)]|uniref:Uncharacterized protein n=1 Tax=Caballeronia mineralivorans PML1(12) TaxID=908627 RepID=A0A0J1CMM8_9BURK|nr:hypothetical protein [Caballeronia mineralivorans]KLU21977.1 hypothetical protein EOS_33080 [Caballeronia mineralivorans PML1(12)]
MRLFDRFKKGPTGLFVLDIYRAGKLIEHFEEKNLIVIGSQQTHALLLGGSVTGQSVTQFGIGTNATAPVFGNTTLTGQYANAITGVSYPAMNEVQFAFAMGSADTPAFGMAISEFGLLTTVGTLYARKARSAPLNFASDISLSGTWVISF